MFSGIVAATGMIERSASREGGVRLHVAASSLGLGDVKVGDSIAVNGVCLTVIAKGKKKFAVDVSRETLGCTAGLDAPGAVNLEKSLKLADRLGGHLVSGHVDGVGEVRRFEPDGESYLLRIRSPAELAKYIARKGSITVQGVSLTVNKLKGRDFDVNLIPHTLSATTLGRLKRGSRVNLEVDMLARYIERLLSASE